jgi:hypothetical protein
MTGYALAYWPEDHPDVRIAGFDSGWKFAVIEDVDTGNGAIRQVWRSREPPENAEQLMSEIGETIGETDLEGFTLFYQPTKKAWQMSTRRKSETGWSVTTVPDEQANNLLSMLEPVSHSLGPLKINDRLRAELKAAVDARREHTAALRARAVL